MTLEDCGCDRCECCKRARVYFDRAEKAEQALKAPAPASPADDGWRDAPDKDGYYRRVTPGSHEVVLFRHGNIRSFFNEEWPASAETPGTRFKFIGDERPPRKPLPKSRSVELTAKVAMADGKTWELNFFADGECMDNDFSRDKQELIDLARKLGIEPTVHEPQWGKP